MEAQTSENLALVYTAGTLLAPGFASAFFISPDLASDAAFPSDRHHSHGSVWFYNSPFQPACSTGPQYRLRTVGSVGWIDLPPVNVPPA